MARGRGRVVAERIESGALEGNALGDRADRDVVVYLPPGYGRDARRYPVIVLLTGFGGLGESPFQRQAFSEALHERVDRLIGTGRMKPAIVASPDCMTALGGSQYVDSAAVGRYETFVVREVVPMLDERFATLAAARHRAVCGKSSGGYGALMLGMKHADVFGAIASHSGDAYFDYCYRFDFVKCWSALSAAGGVAKWLKKFRASARVRSEDIFVLNIVAMSACYSPNPRARIGFDLPFDMDTGAEDERVFARWRRFDPVVACARYARNLRRLRGVYLDCGRRDEFALQVGARILAARLREIGVRKVVHEEFDDGHFGIAYRYDESLPRLSRWIGG